jgi:hypothetical protein
MAAMLHDRFEVFKNVVSSSKQSLISSANAHTSLRTCRLGYVLTFAKDIPHAVLSRRLRILDLQDNKYFDMPYCCYQDKAWGRDI